MFNGERIRELRKDRNYSLEELAGKGGISVSYLSELERGYKKPSLATIEKLSAALNVSSRDFAGQNKVEGIAPAKRIRAFREEKKISPGELAKAAGLSDSYLCGVERGLVTPSISSLKKIAAGLEIPLSHLTAPGSPLSEKLTHIRREQGLNQSQLARQAGVSPGLIGQIERGKVQPSLKTVEKIASALGVSPCYFIIEEDGLKELLHLINPELRSLLLDKQVQAILRMLCQCNEKEFRLILDFIKLLKQANLCEP